MNYTKAIALARMEALDALIGALNRVKDDPAETRRIALAIFRAPEPDEDIDAALDDPPSARSSPGPSATSPERSERAGTSAPAPAPDPTINSTRSRPETPRGLTPSPSLRSGLVADGPVMSARRAQTIPANNTRASNLLAHSGRAP